MEPSGTGSWWEASAWKRLRLTPTLGHHLSCGWHCLHHTGQSPVQRAAGTSRCCSKEVWGWPFLNVLVAFPLSWCLPFTKSYVRTRLLHQQRWETRTSPVVLSEQNTLYSHTQWCSPSFHEGLLNALYLLVNVPGSSLSRGDRELPRYRAHIHHVSNGDMGIGGKSGREGEKMSSYMDIDLRTPSKSLCIYMCINLGVHCGD